jgi:peptidoglycan/xylan/chitin deacetylase (PgdA/CDA1 family)
VDRGRSTQFADHVDRSLRLTVRALFTVAAVLSEALYSHAALAAKPRQIFVPVLIYHHVKALKPSDDAIERGLTVLPSQIDAQLDYLRTTGYHVVTAVQLIQHLRTGSSLPPKPVVLTFDDGYTDMFHGVYQRLLRARLRATFFIVPSFLGTPRYLTWRQVQIMAAHGMDIEAHTMTHPDLTRISPRSVRWQLAESRRELQLRLHRAVRLFAYPYGAHSPHVLFAVSRAGYWAAFTTQQGWVASSARPLIEPRVYVDIDDTITIFAGRLRDDSQILAEDPT